MRMAKATPIAKLADEVNKILEDYDGELEKNLDEITQRVAKAGVTTLRKQAKSMFGGSGEYAKGWKSYTIQNRLGNSVVIYNEHPGLPHLLEHGHAKRDGGRVEGREHIAPVEDYIIERYEREVAEKL